MCRQARLQLMRQLPYSTTVLVQQCDACCKCVGQIVLHPRSRENSHGEVQTSCIMCSPKQGMERRRTPRDREFHAQLRPLARYQPQPAHEMMAEGLLLEARLRARLMVRPACLAWTTRFYNLPER